MKKLFILVFITGISMGVIAQHDHSMMHHADEKKKDTMPMDMHMNMNSMSHAFSRNLPMNRNGSGTSWMPDETPMYGYMKHSNKWMYMLHGNVFLRYTSQDVSNAGSRGGSTFDAPNWIMGMGQTAVGKRGLFRFNVMLSADALTEGGDGYPLLFQTGESWKGQPLVDRQHPHDLFSELSVAYAYSLSKDADVFVYVGYPGEPALGAPAFMHRPSSLYNPDAPLGHHWQDATHITFGVATIGVRYGNFKLEGSSFTGREPDEDRYNFDKARFDSWSARLSYNPGREWALQVSQGFIKSPEALKPEEDIRRTTASVIHAKRLSKDAWLNSALVWGYNRVNDHHKEHSILAESAYSWGRNALYGKYEFVEKTGDELNLDESIFGHDNKFPVNALTLGVNRQLFKLNKTSISAGTQATLYFVDNELKGLYGANPWALQAFIRISPGLMQ
jgi:hypothetical protein